MFVLEFVDLLFCYMCWIWVSVGGVVSEIGISCEVVNNWCLGVLLFSCCYCDCVLVCVNYFWLIEVESNGLL